MKCPYMMWEFAKGVLWVQLRLFGPFLLCDHKFRPICNTHSDIIFWICVPSWQNHVLFQRGSAAAHNGNNSMNSIPHLHCFFFVSGLTSLLCSMNSDIEIYKTYSLSTVLDCVVYLYIIVYSAFGDGSIHNQLLSLYSPDMDQWD